MQKVAKKNGVTDNTVMGKLLNECKDYRRLSKKIFKLRIKQAINAKQMKVGEGVSAE
jgi:hypothetical protein